MPDLLALARLAVREFPDIVTAAAAVQNKLRVVLSDGSYIDFWWSWRFPDRYAHHWERRHIDGTIYRDDNMPDPAWKGVSTFPRHFHRERSDRVEASFLPSGTPEETVRAWLEFARQKLSQEDSHVGP